MARPARSHSVAGLTCRIPTEVRDRLAARAAETGRTATEEAELAVRDWLTASPTELPPAAVTARGVARVPYHLNLPVDLRQGLADRAALLGRSVTVELVIALLRHLSREPIPVATEPAEPPAPKRPPGRPRKPVEEPATPKRPVGRPRKPSASP